MKKFVINSTREKTSIMEVECEKVTPLEDPSVIWIPSNEYKAKILKPTSFHEKKENGKIPTIWYSFAFYETIEEAKTIVEKYTRYAMVDFAKAKHRTIATEEEIQAALATVEVVML